MIMLEKQEMHNQPQDGMSGLDYLNCHWTRSDQQYNDEFYVLRIKGEIDADSQLILQEVDYRIPKRYDDPVATTVIPFKDDLVDYTEVVFKAGLALEGMYAKISDDGTIEVTNRSARIMDQLGVLFDVKPIVHELDKPPEIEIDSGQNIQDSMESFNLLGPIEHEPDLPVIIYTHEDTERVSHNGHSKKKPPHVRVRIDPKNTENLV